MVQLKKCPLCPKLTLYLSPLCEQHWEEYVKKAKGDFKEFQAFNQRVRDALLASDQ